MTESLSDYRAVRVALDEHAPIEAARLSRILFMPLPRVYTALVSLEAEGEAMLDSRVNREWRPCRAPMQRLGADIRMLGRRAILRSLPEAA